MNESQVSHICKKLGLVELNTLLIKLQKRLQALREIGWYTNWMLDPRMVGDQMQWPHYSQLGMEKKQNSLPSCVRS